MSTPNEPMDGKAPVELNTQGVQVMVGYTTRALEVLIDAEAVYGPFAVWVGEELVWASADYRRQ